MALSSIAAHATRIIEYFGTAGGTHESAFGAPASSSTYPRLCCPSCSLFRGYFLFLMATSSESLPECALMHAKMLSSGIMLCSTGVEFSCLGAQLLQHQAVQCYLRPFLCTP